MSNIKTYNQDFPRNGIPEFTKVLWKNKRAEVLPSILLAYFNRNQSVQ